MSGKHPAPIRSSWLVANLTLGLPQVHLIRSTHKLSLSLSPSLFLYPFVDLVLAVSSSFYAFPAPAALEDRLANRGCWPSLHASPRETAKPCGMLSGDRGGDQGGITNEGHGRAKRRTKRLERRNRKGNGTRGPSVMVEPVVCEGESDGKRNTTVKFGGWIG